MAYSKKSFKLAKYKGKSFLIFIIGVILFVATSFIISLGNKGYQATMYNTTPTDTPNAPTTDPTYHAQGWHDWNWMKLNKVNWNQNWMGKQWIEFYSPEKADNTPWYDNEWVYLIDSHNTIMSQLTSWINGKILENDTERVEVKLNTYWEFLRGWIIQSTSDLNDFASCPGVRNAFSEQELKDGLKVKDMENYYYTFPKIFSKFWNIDIYVDILLKVHRKPKMPPKPAPVLEDQEVINISFDSAKIADGLDNNYILGRDYWDENVNDIGVFNLILRKEWLNNYTYSCGMFDKKGNNINQTCALNVEKDLFSGEVLKNPTQPLLKNFLVFSNGIKHGYVFDPKNPWKSKYEKILAWDDRRRTNHIPNYLFDESVNPITDESVEKLNYVNHHRPVVPSLKAVSGKSYNLTFRRPKTDRAKTDINGRSFYMISGYESNEKGVKWEVKNSPFTVSKLKKFVDLAVENYGEIDKATTTHEAETNFIFNHHRGTDKLPFLTAYNDLLQSEELYYIGFDAMGINKAPNTDTHFKHIFPIDDGYSKSYNIKKYYTLQQLINIGFTLEEIHRISNAVDINGKIIRIATHLVSKLDMKMERDYNPAFLEYKRIVPWKMTLKNNLILIPKTLDSVTFKLKDPWLEWNGSNIQLNANTKTMLLDHPYNTLFEAEKTLQIELSTTAYQAIMEMIKPNNDRLPTNKFTGFVVSEITFTGSIAEDWILKIDTIQSFVFKNRLPNGSYGWWERLWDILAWPFRILEKIVDIFSAFLHLGWKGFMWIAVIIGLILLWPIIYPALQAIGAGIKVSVIFLKKIANFTETKNKRK